MSFFPSIFMEPRDNPCAPTCSSAEDLLANFRLDVVWPWGKLEINLSCCDV
jgi:hypothetical protein